MPSPTNEILNPTALIIPKVTEANRDLMVAEEGTIIYNLDTNVLNVCDVDRTAGAGSWGLVTTT
jgi:hypothetical protein